MKELERWRELWGRLGGDSDPEIPFSRLVEAYSEPHRAYHTLDHVRECLMEFDRARGCAQEPDEVEAALWFHDVVYVPGAADNERQSAYWAVEALTEAGVLPAVAHRVADLIMATRHTAPPAGRDARLVVDIDLSILGQPPEKFAAYERKIRREYGWVTEQTYRQARAKILESFLNRDAIYLTSFFRDLYETQARENVERSLARLRG